MECVSARQAKPTVGEVVSTHNQAKLTVEHATTLAVAPASVAQDNVRARPVKGIAKALASTQQPA